MGVVVTIALVGVAAGAHALMQPGAPPRPSGAPPVVATPQPPPPPPVSPSVMTLQSRPPGATVSTRDLDLGTTPVSLDMLQPGRSYRLRVAMPGHVAQEVEVSLDWGVGTRTVELEPVTSAE